MNKVVVIGSANIDLVVKTSRLPGKGETVLGGDFSMFCGGKGANQAVAAARFGSDVCFVGKIGSDIFGAKVLDNFNRIGMKTDHVLVDHNCQTGVALITVDDSGENSIVVAPGANSALCAADIDAAQAVFDEAKFVLMQLEIPLQTLEHVMRIANEREIPVILNPAPAPAKLPSSMLDGLYALTPNETEAAIISGIPIIGTDDAKHAAIKIHEMGVGLVVITLGSKGLVCYDGIGFTVIPSIKVAAIDTTAAGDTFNGVMAAALAEGRSLCEALRLSNTAAAISVTRMGAQESSPFRDEVLGFAKELC